MWWYVIRKKNNERKYVCTWMWSPTVHIISSRSLYRFVLLTCLIKHKNKRKVTNSFSSWFTNTIHHLYISYQQCRIAQLWWYNYIQWTWWLEGSIINGETTLLLNSSLFYLYQMLSIISKSFFAYTSTAYVNRHIFTSFIYVFASHVFLKTKIHHLNQEKKKLFVVETCF